MEQYPPAVPQQQNKLRALVFLKVGLFEIGFVGVVLLLLFGTLNYFNILPVSDAFPNQLGWLPRQTIKQLASPTGGFNNLAIKQNTIPSPSPTEEIELAKQVFSAFLSENLNASFSPALSQIAFVQDKIMKNTFQSVWQTETGTASATFAVSSSNPKDISYLYLGIPFTIDVSSSISAEFAEKNTSKFFSVEPKGIWKCNYAAKTVYCENFWEEKNGTKIGLSMSDFFYTLDKGKEIIIGTCKFNTDYEFYAAKSCNNKFAATGIQ